MSKHLAHTSSAGAREHGPPSSTESRLYYNVGIISLKTFDAAGRTTSVPGHNGNALAGAA